MVRMLQKIYWFCVQIIIYSAFTVEFDLIVLLCDLIHSTMSEENILNGTTRTFLKIDALIGT
jgi:hypothetical protein